MRGTPGFLSTLQTQLESLPLETLERVNRPGGMEVRDLLDFILRPRDYTVDVPDDVDPDVLYEDIEQDVTTLGRDALKDGSTAYCVLAGSSGTRIGSSKNFLKLPRTMTSLLGLKTLQSEGLPHVWVMANPSNRSEVEEHLRALGKDDVKVFTQFESFRLTPDNSLSMSDGSPDLHPCGHGDVAMALVHSGVLEGFLKSGGKRIVVVNVDNVLGAPDPTVLGQHIISGAPLTCEVVKKTDKDTAGGVLCRHLGVDQIVEQFRLSSETDPQAFTWHNTNTMVVNADLDFKSVKWSWHRVKKNVGGQLLIQYERLMQDLTSHFPTQYIGVPRTRRYVPVKTQEDLQKVASLFRRMKP